MDLNKQVNTAGAYILVNNLFVFMTGPNQDNDLCVVRIGGHRENEETVIECLKSGGKAVFQKELRNDIILKPGVHLRFLSMLNKKHPDLINSFIKKSM